MKQKIVIKAHMTCDKCRKSALALAASTYGVQSVGIEGEERDQLVVIGDGVDATSLTSCLRKKVKVGRADIVKVEAVVEKKEEPKPAAAKTTPATPVAEWPPAQWYPYHHPGYYCGPQPGVVYPYAGPCYAVEDPCCADEGSWCTIM